MTFTKHGHILIIYIYVLSNTKYINVYNRNVTMLCERHSEISWVSRYTKLVYLDTQNISGCPSQSMIIG